MKQTILVVEDDPAIAAGLTDLFVSEGYHAISAADGEQALSLYARRRPDCILLDIMLPETSGYDVCRSIRSRDQATPILILTAKSQEIDKVLGLELGADDYIVKPFGIRELLARVRAAVRRSHASSSPQRLGPFSFGDVTIDPRKLRCSGPRGSFPLTPRELHLLREFVAHDGEVLSRFELLDRVWGVRYEGTTRTLDQHIAKLRRKIEPDPARPRHIRTVHGAGYRFVAHE
jgi:DNA-binding response OmpR family regulator